MYEKLDRALAWYKNRNLPSVPGNLSAEVWRTIRLRKTAPNDVASDLIEFWLADWRLVGSAISLAIVLGVTFDSSLGHHSPLATEQRILGVNVFFQSPLTLNQSEASGTP